METGFHEPIDYTGRQGSFRMSMRKDGRPNKIKRNGHGFSRPAPEEIP
jgi:hypothetical protein